MRLLYEVGSSLVRAFVDLDGFDKKLDSRVFEYSFAIATLSRLRRGRVLDAGCTSRMNILPATLAAMGWEVWGIDARPFELDFPGFQFIRADLTDIPFPGSFFDAVCAVSTLEHAGIGGKGGAYGWHQEKDADFRIVSELKRVLRPRGTLVVTLPYGRPRIIRRWMRVYDRMRLEQLFDGWTVANKSYYFFGSEQRWLRVSEEVAARATMESTEAVVLLEVVAADKKEYNY